MIVLPPSWTVVNELNGLDLVHPEGRAVASIEYRERVRPLVRIGAIVRRVVSGLPVFVPSELPDIAERLTTREGEHAALVTIAGTLQGTPAQLDLGVVFGDDFHSLLVALCARADQFDKTTALVRELVATDTHALGPRRRRFEYAPPRGWQAIARGFITDWFPPEYPRDAIHLTAYPANPRLHTPREIYAMVVGAGHPNLRERATPLRTTSGLGGQLFEASYTAGGRPVVKLCAVLEDDRFTYALEVTAAGEPFVAAHHEELDQVFGSVQPIPQGEAPRRDPAVAMAAHWAE